MVSTEDVIFGLSVLMASLLPAAVSLLPRWILILSGHMPNGPLVPYLAFGHGNREVTNTL